MIRAYLALLVLLSGSGCDKRVLISGKVLKMDREHAVFELQTEPGVRVYIERTSATTDGAGHAVLTVPLQQLLDRSSKYLSTVWVSLDGKKGMTRYHGQQEITLPYVAEVAVNIPAGATGAWLALVGSDRGPLTLHVKGDFGDGMIRFADGASVTGFAGPVGAKFRVAGHDGTIGKAGTGEVTLTLGDVLAHLSSSTMAGREPIAEVPAEVEVAGQPKREGKLLFTLQFSMRELVDQLAAQLAAGKPINSAAAAPGGKLMWVRELSGVTSRGRDDTLDHADLLATLSEANSRPGPKCTGYGKGILGMGGRAPDLERSYVDVTIKVFDCRSAKVVFEKTLPGGGEGCPSAVMGSREVKDGPKPAAISAALDQALRR